MQDSIDQDSIATFIERARANRLSKSGTLWLAWRGGKAITGGNVDLNVEIVRIAAKLNSDFAPDRSWATAQIFETMRLNP